MRNIKYYYENESKENAKDWPVKEDGTFDVLTVTRNNILYVYSENAPDVERSLPITNIDKMPPTGITIEASNISSSTFNLTVSAKDNGGSGIERYEITVENKENPSYRPYTPGPIYSSNEMETVTIKYNNSKLKKNYELYFI